jgi:uncharacterized protein YejL (UPF0352 family)
MNPDLYGLPEPPDEPGKAPAASDTPGSDNARMYWTREMLHLLADVQSTYDDPSIHSEEYMRDFFIIVFNRLKSEVREGLNISDLATNTNRMFWTSAASLQGQGSLTTDGTVSSVSAFLANITATAKVVEQSEPVQAAIQDVKDDPETMSVVKDLVRFLQENNVTSLAPPILLIVLGRILFNLVDTPMTAHQISVLQNKFNVVIVLIMIWQIMRGSK